MTRQAWEQRGGPDGGAEWFDFLRHRTDVAVAAAVGACETLATNGVNCAMRMPQVRAAI